jgi:hypothetical protein
MRRFVSLLSFLCASLLIPTAASEASVTQTLSITISASQSIASVNLSNSSFAGGAPSGTVVGAITVTMSPNSPSFSGSLTLSGTDAGKFQIVGTNLETSGVIPAGTYQINIVPTETGVTGSGTAYPFTLTGTTFLNLPLVAWEGGPAYWGRFAQSAAWTNPSFFPIGVWFESVTQSVDTVTDQGAGLNTYVMLTSNSDMSFVRAAGMYGVTQGPNINLGAETIGWFIEDEADMRFGPGNNAYNSSSGQCATNNCGFAEMAYMKSALPSDGRPNLANYGKGVMWWESNSDAATFVNNYTQFVSNDEYWYTDNDLCSRGQGGSRLVETGPVDVTGNHTLTAAECHRSSNYGIVIDRQRSLMAGHTMQPIFGFVEDGHPSTNNSWPTITGPQIQGAVMSSLIHGARGIIYFNHNFGGACISQHVLRDCGVSTVRPYVADINSHIADLASVLNTQSYQWAFNSKLDTMLKKGSDGSFYIFAEQGYPNNSGTYTFMLSAGMTTATSAEVLYENRTVPVTGGTFSDSFAAEYSWHIYKIPPS